MNSILPSSGKSYPSRASKEKNSQRGQSANRLPLVAPRFLRAKDFTLRPCINYHD
jgi:hypothetical protein